MMKISANYKSERIRRSSIMIPFALLAILAAFTMLTGCKTTPLYDATIKGDLKEVTSILDGGVDINATGNAGWNPLLYAASKGNTEMVKLLLDRGADINSRTDFAYYRNWTPLMHAAYNGHTSTVKLLLERGADIEIKTNDNVLESYNKNASQLAEDQGHALIASMIRETQGNYNYYAEEKDRTLQAQKQYIIDNPMDSRGFGRMSYLYSEAKQYDEAIVAAKRAIELKPDNAEAYNYLGMAYFHENKFDEALNAYQKAIELEPKNAILYANIGSLFLEKADYNKAAANYGRAVELTPNDTQVLTALSNTYRLMGRYDDAIELANKVIKLLKIPGSMGITFTIEKGYPDVIELAPAGPAKRADIQVGDKIIEINGKSTKGWNDKKFLESIKGAAGTEVNLSISRKGDTINKTIIKEDILTGAAASSLGLRSLIYRHKGDTEKALVDAEAASTLDQTNIFARVSLGAAYLDQRRYDEAIKLLSLVKDSATARLLEATSYAKQGKMNEAINIYLLIPEEKMSDKNIPQTNDRMVLLQTFKPIIKELRDKAISYKTMGNDKEALPKLAEALKIADDTEAQEIQNELFSMINKNPKLAELPEDARRYALRGELLVSEGNFEQAATEYKKAIQIAPYVSRLYYNLALVNGELKNYTEAIRQIKIYLKATPDASDARAAKDQIIKWELMMEKEQ